MNLLEYQAKTLLSGFGAPVPRGIVIDSADLAGTAFNSLNTPFCMVKAQIEAGERAAGGGIHRADNATAAEVLTSSLLGHPLVTPQTPPEGFNVEQVLIESFCQATRELYLALLLEPGTGNLVALASPMGGSVVRHTDLPQRLSAPSTDVACIELPLNPGLEKETVQQLADALLLEPNELQAFDQLIQGIHRAFLERDATLIEVNPLAITDQGELICLDVKLSIDDNAAYRQTWLNDLVTNTRKSARRYRDGFNLEPLGGNVGCIVTGAGLALATMDLLDDHGLVAANFLDLPPGARVENIAKAVCSILDNPAVDRLLVHAIAGGFTRCDSVADGIVAAKSQSRVAELPMVVRFAGAGRDHAWQLLTNAGLEFERVERLIDIPRALGGPTEHTPDP